MKEIVFQLIRSALISIIPSMLIVLAYSYFIEKQPLNSTMDFVNGCFNSNTIILFGMVMVSEIIRVFKDLISNRN